jgi:hypothetical protein
MLGIWSMWAGGSLRLAETGLPSLLNNIVSEYSILAKKGKISLRKTPFPEQRSSQPPYTTSPLFLHYPSRDERTFIRELTGAGLSETSQ